MRKTQQKNPPRKGEIWLVNFDPTIGVEIKKTRPALIIQNDAGNIASQATIVAAIASTQRKARSFEVQIVPPKGGLAKKSIILLQQIRTIDKHRLIICLGSITPETLQKVEMALKISLALN